MQNLILTSRPPEFLNTLNCQIEAHLSDLSFSVKKLSGLSFMSRTNMYRKLKKTVGMSATEYVRYVRLCKASQLLLNNPDWTIFRVALEVGFAYPSYFTRRFKELFGVCPGKWRAVDGKLEHT